MNLAELGWRPFFQQQLSLKGETALRPARVMSIERSVVGLSFDGGEAVAELELHWQQLPHEQRPTVGDWVLISSDNELEQLLDRQSVFKRKAAGERAEVQLIGANVDTLFIVSSCNLDFNLSRLERYLALAFDAQVTPVIVLTKSDLADAEDYLLAAKSLRRGLEVIAVNSLDAGSIKPLRNWCFFGPNSSAGGLLRRRQVHTAEHTDWQCRTGHRGNQAGRCKGAPHYHQPIASRVARRWLAAGQSGHARVEAHRRVNRTGGGFFGDRRSGRRLQIQGLWAQFGTRLCRGHSYRRRRPGCTQARKLSKTAARRRPEHQLDCPAPSANQNRRQRRSIQKSGGRQASSGLIQGTLLTSVSACLSPG